MANTSLPTFALLVGVTVVSVVGLYASGIAPRRSGPDGGFAWPQFAPPEQRYDRAGVPPPEYSPPRVNQSNQAQPNEPQRYDQQPPQQQQQQQQPPNAPADQSARPDQQQYGPPGQGEAQPGSPPQSPGQPPAPQNQGQPPPQRY